MNKRAAKGTPTSTNLFVLRKLTERGTKEIPSRLHAVDAPHIRRCFEAGLLEQTPAGMLKITASGLEALTTIAWLGAGAA